jgi:hypothetical protein
MHFFPNYLSVCHASPPQLKFFLMGAPLEEQISQTASAASLGCRRAAFEQQN